MFSVFLLALVQLIVTDNLPSTVIETLKPSSAFDAIGLLAVHWRQQSAVLAMIDSV